MKGRENRTQLSQISALQRLQTAGSAVTSERFLYHERLNNASVT